MDIVNESIQIKNKRKKQSRMKINLKKSSIKWILLIMILIVSSLIFIYNDMSNTVDNTIIFMKSVLEGKFIDFYELSVEQAKTNYAANYGILMYIILAIWFLPIFAILKILGAQSALFNAGLFLAKMFIVGMTILSAYLIYKIVLFCTDKKEKASLGVFLFLSSMIVFYPIFIIVQLDIIPIFFMLLGVYGYLKNNKLLFYFSFLLAAPLKMFALILVLPLILLREKNLLKAGIKWISMSGFIVLEKIIFSGSVIYKYALEAQAKDAITQILNSNIYIGNYITVFLALYIGIIIYSYILKNKENDNKTILWICFFVWAIFITTVHISEYWIILVAPFLIINILVNDKYLHINTLLETISGLAFFLYRALEKSSALQDKNLMTRIILPKFRNINTAKYVDVFDMLHKFGLDQYGNAFFTIFIVTIILILILSKPSKENKDADEKQKSVTEGMLLLRVILLYATTCMIIYTYSATANPISYSNIEQEITAGQANLLGIEMDIVTQEIKFDNEIELDELILKALNNHQFRDNFALLNVEIWNVSKNECIFRTSIGCNTIIDENENIYINLKKVKVNKDDNYEIKLSGTNGTQYYKEIEKIYPCFTEKVDEKIGPAKVNGELIDATLCFQIR